jgi:hypothetical protein
MERACDDDELVDRCDGCGGVLEAWDDESFVIYDCFHALHAGCAHGRDACPRCHTPRVHDDDDDQPEQIEAAPASTPDNKDEDSALASDGMGNDDRPRGGETGEPRSSRCDGDGDGECHASMSGSECNHASRLGCCACACFSRRVAELEDRLEEKSAALTETTNVLEMELRRAQSRLCRLEKMYDKLEEELMRLHNGKRAREIEDAEEEEAAERRKERFKVQVPPRPH